MGEFGWPPGVGQGAASEVVGRDVHVESRSVMKSILLKNAGMGAIGFDLLFLAVFSTVTITAATLLFKREL